MEEEDHSKNKYEHNQIMQDDDRLNGHETCGVLVLLVSVFFMYHINNLNVKDLRVVLCYHSESENLKGIPNKV